MAARDERRDREREIERGREGEKERAESREQKAKSEQRAAQRSSGTAHWPKLGYNPVGIVLIPNTNITTRAYSVHKFQ